MTEIDDEMAVRAVTKILDCMWHGRPMDSTKTAREILEAALNPPKPEPEIEVTEEMKQAGRGALNLLTWIQYEPVAKSYLSCNDYTQAVTNAYRAMRALEPKAQSGAAYAAKDARQGVNDAGPVKETGGGVWYTHRHRRSTDQGTWCTHCREDDPK